MKKLLKAIGIIIVLTMLINSVLIVNATTSTEINSAVGDNFKNYDQY